MNVRETARHIASLGHGRDSVLAHINPEEAALLAKLSGGTVNPHTGLPQFGFWSNLGGALTGGGIGGAKELFKDPRKWFGDRAENPVTKVVGPIALDFIPGVGPLLGAAAAAAYKGHDERHAGPAKEYGQSALAGVGNYLAGKSASNATYGSGSAMGYAGILKQLFGGFSGGGSSSGDAPATSPPPAAPAADTGTPGASAASGNNAYLATQVQQLKQQLQQSYADAGQADSPELQQSLQDLDAWHMAQSQAAQTPQPAATS